ncbi:MAG: prolipoprotein diacylglyceryl transferase [Gordonia sp. (in: high G+C Gram-positive bacteria)]
MSDATLLAYIPSPSQGVWHLGPVPIRAYALCIIIGIIVAVWWGDRRWRARGGQPGEVLDVAIWAVPFGLVGGRLYHVMTDWQTYFGAGGKGFAGALRIWDGGLGIWGAVALGALGAWLGCRFYGIKLPPFGDAIAPAILLAQAIGRLGNYFNQELFGDHTTLPWGLEIFQRVDADGNVGCVALDAAHCNLMDGSSNGVVLGVVQPTFLYEMIWNILVVIALVLIDRRFQIGHGRLFALYVAGYCLGRFGVELLRSDHATHILGIRINVFTAAIVFLAAALYVVMARKGREQGLEVYWPKRAAELAAEGVEGYVPGADVADDDPDRAVAFENESDYAAVDEFIGEQEAEAAGFDPDGSAARHDAPWRSSTTAGLRKPGVGDEDGAAFDTAVDADAARIEADEPDLAAADTVAADTGSADDANAVTGRIPPVPMFEGLTTRALDADALAADAEDRAAATRGEEPIAQTTPPLPGDVVPVTDDDPALAEMDVAADDEFVLDEAAGEAGLDADGSAAEEPDAGAGAPGAEESGAEESDAGQTREPGSVTVTNDPLASAGGIEIRHAPTTDVPSIVVIESGAPAAAGPDVDEVSDAPVADEPDVDEPASDDASR